MEDPALGRIKQRVVGTNIQPITRVDRFEFATVDSDTGVGQQAKLSAKADNPRAHFADHRPVILAEIGNRLVIGSQAGR